MFPESPLPGLLNTCLKFCVCFQGQLLLMTTASSCVKRRIHSLIYLETRSSNCCGWQEGRPTQESVDPCHVLNENSLYRLFEYLIPVPETIWKEFGSVALSEGCVSKPHIRPNLSLSLSPSLLLPLFAYRSGCKCSATTLGLPWLLPCLYASCHDGNGLFL